MKTCIATIALLISMSTTIYGQQLDPVTRWATLASSYDVHPNLVYEKANGQDIKLDVITIEPKTKPRPTLLFIHGGGWMSGTKDQLMLAPLPFLAKGMNIVNIDYRLADVSLAPAAVEDCRCALRWVFQHAKEYGFDTNKIVVAGESAGGHLALTTGMLEPSDGFDNNCPARDGDMPLKVAAIVSYSGPTDVAELLEGPKAEWFAKMWFGHLPNRMELAREVSPLTYVRHGLPPIIMAHGKQDPYVPYEQAMRLHEALNRAGDLNQLITVPGAIHGWAIEKLLNVQEQVLAALEKYGILSHLSGQQLDPVTRWAASAASYEVSPNIVYQKANGQNLKLDVITAGPRTQTRPTIILIHGGGWMSGNKDGYRMVALPYLAKGMDTVNIDYRLADVSLAPAAVEDCRCALRWVFQHAKEYGFDTNKIVVAGGSAGGHLALMTGMLEPSAGFDNECPKQAGDAPLKVAAIISNSGPTDVAELLEGPKAEWFAKMWFGSLPNRMELAREVSPLTYVRPGLPPIIMMHADHDPLVPYEQVVRLHEALDHAGDPNRLITIPSTQHGWPIEQQLKVQAQVFKFLEKYGVIAR